MSITITDPNLLAQLSQVQGKIDLKFPNGDIIGTLSVEDTGRLPPGVKSPFSDAEMAERRQDKDRTGRALADILRDLESRK